MKRYVPLLLLLLPMIVAYPQVQSAEKDPELVEAERVLTAEKIDTSGDALMKYIRDRIIPELDREKLEKAIKDLGDDEFGVREQAQGTLLRAGKIALPLLRAAQNSKDPEIASRSRKLVELLEAGSETLRIVAAARVLADRKTEGAIGLLLEYLPLAEDQYSQDSLFRSLFLLAHREGKIDEILKKAAQDKNVLRRCAAAYCLSRAGQEDRKLALEMLEDKEFMVQFQAALGLVMSGAKEGVPVLVRLLRTAPRNLAFESEALLYHLAGEKPPTGGSVGKGDDDARAKAASAWEKWWQDNEKTIDLSKRPSTIFRNITIVCEHDGSGKDGMGRIWECGKDGKAIWQLDTNLGGPIDVQVLPGGKVLVSEYKSNQVTERDREGKILWSHKTNSSAVSCQRLSNGNTLICTLSEITEVSRDNKVSTRIPGQNGSLWCAEKLKSGNILFCESGGNVVEADTTGKRINTVNVGGMGAWGGVEMLPNGRLLVAKYSENKIVEIDWSGKVFWEASTPNPSYAARLPNGITLATNTNTNAIVELDREGKEISKRPTQGRPFRTRGY